MADLTHARARAEGPLSARATEAIPEGFVRLAHGESVVVLPTWPDGSSPALLEEYQVAPPPVERSGETRRVLAACLRMCWADLAEDPWPGVATSVDDVLACYRALTGRGDDTMRSWAIGALRRLHDTAWIVMSDGLLRLGPRCAMWPPDSHAQLRELMRRIPAPSPDHSVTYPPNSPLPATDQPSTPLGAAREETDSDLEGLLSAYDERRRAELVAAFMAVEHAAEPVHEARFAALRDPALRRTLAEMLARRGRSLIQRRESWISGYDDAVTAPARSPEGERAVLTLVLVHSVAIPRADGLLSEDTWLSPYPVAVEELRRRTLLPIGELESALRALRQAGLLTQVKAVSDEISGGYVPGPQFHRLTTAARKRLQEELILAAGPHTPLASAIRSRRASRTARPGSAAVSTEPTSTSTTDPGTTDLGTAGRSTAVSGATEKIMTETSTVQTNAEGSA